MKISLLVKKTLIEQKITQMEISTKLGFTTSQFISNICRGVSALPPKKFRKFAKYTGVPLQMLIEAHLADERERVMTLVGL